MNDIDDGILILVYYCAGIALGLFIFWLATGQNPLW